MATELLGEGITRDQLIDAMENLPAESLGELCEYVAFLQWKARRQAGKAVKVGRLCQDLPAMTDEEIDVAREEVINIYSEPATAN